MKAEVISGGIEDLQYKIDFFRVSDKLKSSSIRENRVSNALYFLYPGSNPEKSALVKRFRIRSLTTKLNGSLNMIHII